MGPRRDPKQVSWTLCPCISLWLDSLATREPCSWQIELGEVILLVVERVVESVVCVWCVVCLACVECDVCVCGVCVLCVWCEYCVVCVFVCVCVCIV